MADAKPEVSPEEHHEAGYMTLAKMIATASQHYGTPASTLSLLHPALRTSSHMSLGPDASPAFQVVSKAPGAPDPTGAPAEAPEPIAPPLAPQADVIAQATPGSAAAGMATADYNEGAQGVQDANTMGGQALSNEQAATQAEGQAAGRGYAAKGALGEEKAAAGGQAVQQADADTDRMAQIQQAGEAAAHAQMTRINAAADAASGASIKGFYADKSAGARIMGVIAQILGGAANGLAGNPAAPTAMDNVIAQDMQRQIANLNNKQKTVRNEQTMMQQLLQATGDQEHAMQALYQAHLQRAQLVGNQLNSKFATPIAQAANEQLQAQLQQKLAQSQQTMAAKLLKDNITEKTTSVDSLVKLERAKNEGNINTRGENAEVYRLAGTDKYVNQHVYKQFSEREQAYKGSIAVTDQINYLFKHAKEIGYAKAAAQYKDLRAKLGAVVRKTDASGAALSSREEQDREAQLPNAISGSTPLLADFFGRTGPEQIAGLQAASSRSYFGVVNNAIKDVHLDAHDPVYGRHVRNYATEQAAIAGDRNGR